MKNDCPISVDLREKVKFLFLPLFPFAHYTSLPVSTSSFFLFFLTFLISFSFFFFLISFYWSSFFILFPFLFPCSNPIEFSCLLHSHSFKILIFFFFFILPFDFFFLFSLYFLLFPSFDTWLNVSHSHKCTTWLIPRVTPLGCHVASTCSCHVSPDTWCLEKREILIVSDFNKIRLGN